MASVLAGKRILLGVTGSIAAYKAPDFVRRLQEEEALVSVVLSRAGARFIPPLTFQALTGNRVYDDLFPPAAAGAEAMPHIALARESDLLLIAPATAQTIAKLAAGMADNLLTTVALAFRAPVLICPAMNSRMYLHPATRKNLAALEGFDYGIVDSCAGAMACGEEGPGRLPDWSTVREAVIAALTPRDLQGRAVLVTAGPTREPLDPVRFLSNRSSGKMGFAMARTARRRGAQVILVSGPTALEPPPGVELVRVTTALEMRDAVLGNLDRVSIVVKTAAVADYRPVRTERHKIKKGAGGLPLELVANPDILKELGGLKKEHPSLLLVGFAAESRDFRAEGLRKLEEKNLDLLVVNDITRADSGFDSEANQVLILDRQGTGEEVELRAKEEVADRIWDRVVRLLNPARDLPGPER